MNNAYNKILIDSLENISDWSSLKTRLEKYNTSQTETTRKKTIAGKIFEYFAKYYFLTEPEQTDLYKEAYLFEEIPFEISQKLKLPTVDHGIDILLKDKKGKYHAVQCKFKNDESQKLSWSGDKIANVFALGTHCDSIIVFTNVADVTNVAKNLGQYSQIAYDRLISIQPDVFENILLRAKSLKTKELVKYKPLEHQEIAINKVTEYFKSGDRGQLILPCGAGKTLAALWIKEKLMCKSTLVLLPSLALLKQIKNEWARHKNHQFDYICVCSEKDIDKDRIDTPKVNTYEIGGTVTTDSNLVTDFLHTDENKIVYSTYQSLKVIQDACTKNNGFSFSLTICDEAHRTAGSKNKNVYTLIHDNVKIPSDKRLYMTATPKVATTSLKTKLGDEYELLCDMSNPEVFGEEAHRMSFGEAIDKGILVDYKIIGIGVTDKQIKEFIEKQNYTGEFTLKDIAHNFALDLVMNKYSAFHALTFHSKVHLAKEFAERNQLFFEKTFSEYVEGNQTTTYRSKVLHNFKTSPKAVVSNARCLTEGVDVPTIDLIYFCDPKTSKIDIVQASGRALRTDKNANKEMGYIVVPLFHHIDEDIETEIKRKPIFNYLIQVVRSLCDQDERLQAEINAIAFQKGKRESSKIEIELPDSETERIIKFEGLEQKLRTVLFDEIIEKNKDNWEIMFMRLKEFLAEHGHMNVSRSDDKQLQNWIYERRRSNREGRIDPKQKRRLDEIGFDWKSEQLQSITDFDEIWWNNYEKLIDFHKENGHSEVPARYKKDKSLGTWVVAQGQKRRENRLSQDRIDLLDELNFNWNRYARVFDQFCEKLVEFKEKYGHTEVPILSKDFPKLGRWTNKYRLILNNGTEQTDGSVKHKSGSLSKEQIEKLEDLGFKKSIRIKDWYVYYQMLKNFYDENEHSKPSLSENGTLYYWCYRLRKQQTSLSDEQRKLLEEIDFDFSLDFKFSSKGSRTYWEERIIELQLFFEEKGHFNITRQNEEFEGLYSWLVFQRRYFKNGQLSDSKINDLKKIGFDFDKHFQPKYANKTSGDVDWNDRFEELKEYFATYGTFYISSKEEQFKSLLWWLRYQRKLFREGKLSLENAEKLIELGYSFETTYRGTGHQPKSRGENSWNEKFEELKQYYSEYNTFFIPGTLGEYSSLQSWVRYQRKQYREQKLDIGREQKLKSIGFSFVDDFRGKKIKYDDVPEKEENSQKTERNTWEQNYLKLLEYKIKYGNCNVPRTFEDKSLSYFVTRQRHNYKTQNLTDGQIKKLELLSFDWEVERPTSTLAWDNQFSKLKEFFDKYGHSHYKKSNGDETLYNWVLRQRMDFNKGQIANEKLEQLNSINFVWDASSVAQAGRPDEERWQLMYDKLKRFKAKNGNCLVPQIYSEDKSFGRWVNDQRNNKKKGKLSEEREKLLQELDFVWDTKEFEWNQKLEQLKEFYNEFGHFEIKQNDKGYEGLYYWLYKIRKDGVTPDKKAKLEEIGYEFIEYKPENWFEMFSKLAKHKEATGNFDFEDSENEIAKWLSHQKILISRAELPKNKINILAAIGLNHQSIPKPKKKNKKNSANWDEMMEMLKEYHRIHGDFNVPKKYSINQTLSSWLYYQKTLKRTNKLEEDKIKALENIGFEFPKPLENQKSWEERFEELLEYKAKNGDCQVPVRFKENQQLATWVRTQRRNYKEGTIDTDKKQKLENIGFIWRVNN